MADTSAADARAGAGDTSSPPPNSARDVLEARAQGAAQQKDPSNWAKSPGSIAAFTIVFSIVAIACVYVLWRGPNRKVLPCIKRKKAARSISDKEAEAAAAGGETGAGAPENWRRTIVRETAPFPMRKSQAPGTLLPPDLYYDEKLSRQSTTRSSLSNYTQSVYSQATPSNVSNNRRSVAHPGMMTPEIAAPQAVHSPGMGVLGGDLFGLHTGGSGQQQRTSRAYLQPGEYTPRSTTSVYSGRSATASPTPGDRSRASMVRKSTASSISVPFVPSPLAYSASGPDDGQQQPRRPSYHRSRSSKGRTVSFVDDGQSMMDARSINSAPRQGAGGRSGGSPPRGADARRASSYSMPNRMSLVPPGALGPHPPMPSLPWRTHPAPAVYYPAAPAPRTSWNTSQAYLSSNEMYPASYNAYAGAPDFNPLPAGALAADHPVALAHKKLASSDSSGSDGSIPPVPQLPPGASPGSLAPAFVPPGNGSQPLSPPRANRASQAINQPPSPPRAPVQAASPPRIARKALPNQSPPARGGREPTQPGYAATSARMQTLSASPPRQGRKVVSPPQSAEGPAEGSGSHDHTGSSTTPASTMENYTTPTSSPPTSAPSSRNKHANHSRTPSSSSHGSTGSGRRKRGLWFESIDENHTMVTAGDGGREEGAPVAPLAA